MSEYVRAALTVVIYASILYSMLAIFNHQIPERRLVLVVVLAAFHALVMVFIVDKLAPMYSLLNAKENEALFALISSVALITVGYYFAKTHKDD